MVTVATRKHSRGLQFNRPCILPVYCSKLFNMFAATELSRQLMCIGKCYWRVYSSFSTCNSAVHWHHSR